MGSEIGFGLQVAQPLGCLARENQREASQVNLLPPDAVDEDVNYPSVDAPDFLGQFCRGRVSKIILFEQLDVGAYD